MLSLTLMNYSQIFPHIYLFVRHLRVSYEQTKLSIPVVGVLQFLKHWAPASQRPWISLSAITGVILTTAIQSLTSSLFILIEGQL